VPTLWHGQGSGWLPSKDTLSNSDRFDFADGLTIGYKIPSLCCFCKERRLLLVLLSFRSVFPLLPTGVGDNPKFSEGDGWVEERGSVCGGLGVGGSACAEEQGARRDPLQMPPVPAEAVSRGSEGDGGPAARAMGGSLLLPRPS